MDDMMDKGLRIEDIKIPTRADSANHQRPVDSGGARDVAAEDLLSSPMLRETQADAELFVQYAAGAGIEVSDDIRRAVFAARPSSAGGDPQSTATNLLAATTKLARGLYPVTAASLHSTNGDADRTVRTLRRAAIILAAVILPISVASFATSAISEAIKQQIDEANSIALRLRAELPPQEAQSGGATPQLVLAPGASEFDVFMQLQQLAETIRAIDGRALQLRWFVPFMVGDPWQVFRSDPDKMKELLQLDRRSRQDSARKNPRSAGRALLWSEPARSSFDRVRRDHELYPSGSVRASRRVCLFIDENGRGHKKAAVCQVAR